MSGMMRSAPSAELGSRNSGSGAGSVIGSERGLLGRAQHLLVVLGEVYHRHRVLGADLAVAVLERLDGRAGLREGIAEGRVRVSQRRGALQHLEVLRIGVRPLGV